MRQYREKNDATRRLIARVIDEINKTIYTYVAVFHNGQSYFLHHYMYIYYELVRL